jgi:hypothetical protein
MNFGVTLSLALAALLQDAPYDSDRHHPWNDLHRALFTWHPLAAGQKEEVDPDPRLWPQPKEFADHWTVSTELAGAIDRFDPKLIQDPLKRALLQHDLWMFLDGLEGLPMSNTHTYAMEGDKDRDALRQKLVPILRRLALTPEEMKSLPDNYAQAVKAKTYAAAFDPKDPERSFLPPDLWEPEGPWVLVGRENGAVHAEEHVKLMRGRSVFLIFIALPGGRAATLDFVNGLKSIHRVTSIPKMPLGTRVMLLRRALLLDAKGLPYLSPLTEEIQMRASIEESHPGPAGIFEFHLVRSDLFGGVGGGLRASGVDEEAVLPFFNRIETSRVRVRTSCTLCHRSGADLMQGFRLAGFDRENDARLYDGVALQATTVDREAALTVERQRKDASWALISRCWPKD